jgi:uncharacterized protein YndB with AHSA1/START domain
MAETTIVAEAGSHQIEVRREFEAPRELVFRAYAEPRLLEQWLGPRRLSMEVETYEFRHGGAWRYVNRDGDGNEFGFRGVFHGTPSVEGGIVQTFEFEGVPGHVSLDTATFEDVGGRTLVRWTSVFQSVADRDAIIEAGMEGGVREGMDRLSELLPRLIAGR